MATKSLGRVSIVPQGDYDENQVYERLDLVKDSGKIYLSLKEDNTSLLADEDSWMLLTESGRFEDLTPQELETLLQPFNEAANSANQAAVAANEAAENALTGINGTATESNVPNTGAGFFRYIVTTPITTGSAWGIEVSQAELDDNWVFFNVKDGVITKDSKPQQGGKSAYELAVEAGFSGTESEWLDSLNGADGQNGIADWSPTAYPVSSQVLHAGSIWESEGPTLANQEPSTDPVWVKKLDSVGMEALYAEGSEDYYLNGADLPQENTTAIDNSTYLQMGSVVKNSIATEFNIRANTNGNVTLIHFRQQQDGSGLEINRQDFTCVTGLNTFPISYTVKVGDKFALKGGGVVLYTNTGIGMRYVASSAAPMSFSAAGYETPSAGLSSNKLVFNLKIQGEPAGVYPKIKKEVILTQNVTVEQGKNLFNKETMVLVNRLIDNTGSLLTIAGSKVARIPVLPETEYSLELDKYGLGNGGAIRYVKADLSKISHLDTSTLPTSDSGVGKKLTTPANTAFIEANLYYVALNYGDMTDRFQIEKGKSVTGYEQYQKVVTKINGHKLSSVKEIPLKSIKVDENIVFMGDSITASTVYDYVAAIFQVITFNSVLRIARSGATWTNTANTVYDITSTDGNTTDDNTIWNQINKLKNLTDNNLTPIPTIVYISAGTNDYSRPKGDVTTAFTGPIISADPKTILDIPTSVRFNIELLLSYYPNVKIVLSTPLQRGIADNATIFQIGNLIEDSAKRLSVHCIRQDYEAGVYGYNEKDTNIFLYDALHLNAKGALKVGRWLGKKLKTFFA